MSPLRFAPALTLFVVMVAGAPAIATDWPQVGGPDRDFTVFGVELANDWPEDGPAVVWERPLGKGYSGIAVAGERLFTMYREGEEEAVVALSSETGETLWEHRSPAPFAEYMRMEHGSGPHTTPLVVGDTVYAVGIHGVLMAFDVATGDVRWQRDLVAGMGGTEMDRGYSNSPLRFQDTLIVPVGGEGQGLVAFDLADGEIRWQALDFDNSYSSVQLIEIGDETQLVWFTGEGVVAVDPTNGTKLWEHGHETMYGLNISVPLWSPADGQLFLSSAYNGGSRMLAVGPDSAGEGVEELWAHKQMRVHISNMIRVGDVVYASSGDFGAVPMAAVDAASGEVLWRDRAFARANMILADGKLIILDEDGVLGLATPSREGLEVHAKVDLFDTKAWAAPTLVGNHLYARDEAEIKKLELP